MKLMMARLTLAVLWLLHWLPLPLLALIGNAVGALLYALGHERRTVALTNLRLCFPALSETERTKLAREHFAYFGRSFIERNVLWWASESRLRRLIRVSGLEHLQTLRDQPVILLVPHFVALDVAWLRLSMDVDMVSVYAKQKNPVFDAALLQGRLRFGDQQLLSRQDGMRGVLRALKQHRPFFYLPDMDYGPRDAIFVPFFGVQAATITGLSRVSRLSGAAVVPVITRILPMGAGYEVSVQPAWQNWPAEEGGAATNTGGEAVAAEAAVVENTAHMNRYIEAEVRKQPAQYFWLHKRFKTRPAGEARFYD